MATASLRQLIYISTAAIPQTAQIIDDMLRVSRRSNERDGVTGLLVAGGNRYMQLIEGRPSDIAATMDRIVADVRHRHVHILLDHRVPERSFADWSMAFLNDPRLGEYATFQELATAIHDMVEPGFREQVQYFARIFSATSNAPRQLWD